MCNPFHSILHMEDTFFKASCYIPGLSGRVPQAGCRKRRHQPKEIVADRRLCRRIEQKLSGKADQRKQRTEKPKPEARKPIADSRSLLNNFHSPNVTSDLAPANKMRNHGRGRDGRVSPHHRAAKSFVMPILVSKSFRLPILRGISRLTR